MAQWLSNIFGGKSDSHLERSIPLEKVPFVVFDTETTGLNPAKDRIISISAIKVVSNNIYVEDSIEYFIRQELEGKQENIAVHGILPKHVVNADDEAEVLSAFSEYCTGSVLVGHHVAFDIKIVNSALKRHKIQMLKNTKLDTIDLAIREDFPGGRSEYLIPEDYSLDSLIRKYAIPDHDRHTASGDVMITAVLLLKLLQRAQKRGLTTLGDILK